ncbi:MAG: hypothetical protein Q8N08_05565 [Methanobacteriaceae archaeon]|nr:hypothetical protein [Methanobacteriaceae archaeon]
MWKVSNWIWLVTTGPLIVVGVVFIFLGLTASPGALTDDGYPLNNFYYLMGASFIIFPALGALGVFLFYKRINDREIYLINNGIEGQAEILQREQTGTYLNEQPEVKFILLVTIPGEEPYQIEHKEVVNLLDVGSITEGKIVPVRVDPKNPKNMLLLYG